LVVLDYKEMEHAGFRWLVTDEGASFVGGIKDWSLQGLAAQDGWKRSAKTYHTIYRSRELNGRSYLVKSYPPKSSRRTLLAQRHNRARREFWNTIESFEIGIRTVLPIAFGERTRESRWGILVYPYLEDAASLATLYQKHAVRRLTVRERQQAERIAGAMLRDFVAEGMFVYDLSPDQFLVQRTPAGQMTVYWVDLERVKRRFFFRQEEGIRSLGKLLAQMEWGRRFGDSITYSSMMRVGRGYFRDASPGRLDRNLCRRVIQAAQAFWRRHPSRAARKQSESHFAEP
jgi:hypothetical protein